mgnify:CR=1 FL=1
MTKRDSKTVETQTQASPEEIDAEVRESILADMREARELAALIFGAGGGQPMRPTVEMVEGVFQRAFFDSENDRQKKAAKKRLEESVKKARDNFGLSADPVTVFFTFDADDSEFDDAVRGAREIFGENPSPEAVVFVWEGFFGGDE